MYSNEKKSRKVRQNRAKLIYFCPRKNTLSLHTEY